MPRGFYPSHPPSGGYLSAIKVAKWWWKGNPSQFLTLTALSSRNRDPRAKYTPEVESPISGNARPPCKSPAGIMEFGREACERLGRQMSSAECFRLEKQVESKFCTPHFPNGGVGQKKCSNFVTFQWLRWKPNHKTNQKQLTTKGTGRLKNVFFFFRLRFSGGLQR